MKKYTALAYALLTLTFIGFTTGCDNLFGGKEPLGKEQLKAALSNAVNAEGKKVSAESLLDTHYLLIYFSAHWCPPCRQFTPKLVRFYNSYGNNPPFDLVFVSSDKSAAAMFTYMKETKMPWAALEFKSKNAQTLQSHFAGRGIPCLVLIDPNGKVLADSFKGKKNIGPQSVLTFLTAELKKAGVSKGKKATHSKKKKKKINTTALQGRFKLTGTGKRQGKAFAIINGKIFNINQNITSNVVVKKITTTYVELSVDGEPFRIKK